jgi:hypothetical protein
VKRPAARRKKRHPAWAWAWALFFIHISDEAARFTILSCSFFLNLTDSYKLAINILIKYFCNYSAPIHQDVKKPVLFVPHFFFGSFLAFC